MKKDEQMKEGGGLFEWAKKEEAETGESLRQKRKEGVELLLKEKKVPRGEQGQTGWVLCLFLVFPSASFFFYIVSRMEDISISSENGLFL